MNNREKLIDLMHDHQLDRHELAELVRVDLDTVRSWLLPHESPQAVAVPDMAVELLEMKLTARTVGQGADDPAT